jgi:hypothetical protein
LNAGLPDLSADENEKAGQIARPFRSSVTGSGQDFLVPATGYPTKVFSSTLITIFPSASWLTISPCTETHDPNDIVRSMCLSPVSAVAETIYPPGGHKSIIIL